MKIQFQYSLPLVIALLILSSCASRKKMAYLQGIDNNKSYEATLKYEPTLQPDDLLSIVVSAENPEVASPFNLPQIQGNNTVAPSQNGRVYLIDNKGYIDYPVLGKLKIGGLTRTQASDTITKLVSNYITDPSINLRILNYKISVLGEVTRPGTFNINSERITILEALGLAGDLTIYGKRTNILVIHDEEGKKTYTRMDLTDASILDSPSYYLAQNDIVVVEPNRTKMNSSVVGPNINLLLAGVSALLTLLIFIKTY